MANIGEPLRRVKIIPLTEPVRGPEPERRVPAPGPATVPAPAPSPVPAARPRRARQKAKSDVSTGSPRRPQR